jgi:putative methyltransferase (TIGR04325 family)
MTHFVDNWCPPILRRKLLNFLGRNISIEGNYSKWDEAASECSGYDSELILSKVLSATLKVKEGNAVYERDSVLFYEIENNWPITTGLMWAAARNSGKLDVLDFGGSLGSCYFQNLNFISTFQNARWSVVEQAHYVNAGNEYIQNHVLKFYPSIESCLEENNPNVVLLSSVLQYIPNLEDVIKKINQSGIEMMIIDRTPFHKGEDNKIAIQRVPKSIYEASYPIWVFSEGIFNTLLSEWDIIAKIKNLEGFFKFENEVNINFMGYILRKKC